MLVVMRAQATEEQVRAVCKKIEDLGYRAHAMPGSERTAIGITGNQGEVEAGTLEEMPGVQVLIRVSKPYKLVSRDVKQENTVIRFPGTSATFGGPGLAVVAGPCAIENREQALIVAEQVSRAGADRKSTRLNSSHSQISYAVFCLKKKKDNNEHISHSSVHVPSGNGNCVRGGFCVEARCSSFDPIMDVTS